VGNRPGWVTTYIEAVRMAWAIRSRRWWSRRPRAPFPDRPYLKWRAYTAYGDSESSLVYADLRSFLAWRKGLRRYVKGIR
jgi:hypothetical protein